MKIFLAKSFFKIGDINFNFNKIKEIYDNSLNENCDLLIFSEMAITGFPCYELFLNSNFINESNKYIENLVDYTKGKKTRILLGCPYFIEASTKNDIIKKSQLFNSMILINSGYIDSVANKTTISKDNLFDEYKYFDIDCILNSITYENDNFDILIGDEINDNKNILFIKERDTEFIVCVDSEISKNIIDKKIQLTKLAKWTKKNIIYLNNIGYDLKNDYKFFGETFIINPSGEFVYNNTEISENILKFEVNTRNGFLNFDNLNKLSNKDCNFINIIANNYKNKIIVIEVKDKNFDDLFLTSNIKLITFNKNFSNEKINYIDCSLYISNLTLNENLKKIIINNLYDNCIYIK